jgi:cell division protein FtsB
MSFMVTVKRKTRAALVPAVFLSLVAYFIWQAQQGNRGLNAWGQRQGDQVAAEAELVRAKTDLAGWERRVQAMRRSPIDRDTLDERARAVRDLTDPSDIVVLYPQNKRLF